MKTLKRPGFLLWGALLALIMAVACQRGDLAGGGSNTGNALTGRLLASDGTKMVETGERILVLMYDPETMPVLPLDSATGRVFSDTLPDTGAYHFDSIPVSTVNLEFRTLSGALKLFKPGIVIPKDDTLDLGTDTLLPVFERKFQITNTHAGDTLIGSIKGTYYISYITSADTGLSVIRFSGLPVGIREFLFSSSSLLNCRDTFQLLYTYDTTTYYTINLKCQ